MNKVGKGITRRTFIGWTWGASIVGLFGQAAAGLFQFFAPRVEPGAFGSTVEIGAPEEFEAGTITYVRQGRFYVSRLEDGGILAIWQRCTHLGCTVRHEDGQFFCPCHDSSFSRQGEIIHGPAPRPLDLFPISQQDGVLMVDTSQTIERNAFEASQAFYPPDEGG